MGLQVEGWSRVYIASMMKVGRVMEWGGCAMGGLCMARLMGIGRVVWTDDWLLKVGVGCIWLV